MKEQKQGFQTKEDAPKTVAGAKGAPSSWKRLLAKKWVYPATYLAAAAIILTLMWVYQDVGKNSLTKDNLGLESAKTGDKAKSPDTVAVMAPTETMQWPVKDRNEVSVILPFFDSKASNESRQAAMIEYQDTMIPSTGLGIARKDKQTFDVLAAMSGKVTAVDKNPVVGNLVEITHSNGLVTIYQSLADVKVQKDAQVKKGDVIATAGRNDLEKSEDIHLHFEVRQGTSDGPVVNPGQFLNADQ